ncbi:MAG: Fic family protein, partial [Phycisphaeraceae bacterium]|nr:Fic family protein [Phycisphaeraceae bacterium]
SPAAAQRLLAEYRPWRKLRHVASDLGIPAREAWTFVKRARIAHRRELGLTDGEGRPFGLTLGPHLLAPLHQIDRATAPATGGIAPSEGESLRERLRIRMLMDESAESSIMEGAATTLREAIDLLRTDRPPQTRGEVMIANNYAAMREVKGSLEKPLSLELLLEWQNILTAGTLKHSGEAGRLRISGENVRVVDQRDNTDIYTPPPADQLPARLARLCEFANLEHSGESFLHPILKAIVLHFMIGYEHPFVDGNGRTARAVFYWQSLRSGYDIFEYLAISEILRKSFAQYPQAYVDTELDDGDLTYFVLFHLRVIQQSLARFEETTKREQAAIERSRALLKIAKSLNLRQRLLLDHGLRHPQTLYTVKGHMNSHGITAPPARADLNHLVKLRLLITSKRGKEVIYHIAPGLSERLARKGI